MTSIELLALRLFWTSAHLGLRTWGKPKTPERKALAATCWSHVHDITRELGYPPAPQTAPWLDRRR